MLRSCYRVVVDLIRPDGTFETRVVRSDIRSYTEVEKLISGIDKNPPPEFNLFSSVSARVEPSLSLVA